MKLNKNIYLLALGSVMLLPMSCKDSFLEEKNTKAINEAFLFKKKDDAYALLSGIYDTFHDGDYIIKSLFYQANFLSQDFKNIGADVFFESYEVPTTFNALTILWRRSYAGIAEANNAIPIIAKMKDDGVIDQQLANQLTGEALFLRGLFYTLLASDFGGVPVMLGDVNEEVRRRRSSQDEVFAQVEIDMKAASALLPWKQDQKTEDIGRATKGAALAYMGDAQMWQKKYAEAAATYEQLVGKYHLEEEFLKIHEFNNQNGKESIFEVQFMKSGDMEWGASNDVNGLTQFCMPNEVAGAGWAVARKSLYDSFEAGDKRKFPTVIGPGDEHPSPAIQIKNYKFVKEKHGGINTLGTKEKPFTADGRTGYYGVKTWRDPSVNETKFRSEQNIMLLRYGQVLLSKAEAYLKSG
ncbi:MAG: RagB/SusD family nutrient uptake outer membrane protein, partial [Bacteroidota bacterium]